MGSSRAVIDPRALPSFTRVAVGHYPDRLTILANGAVTLNDVRERISTPVPLAGHVEIPARIGRGPTRMEQETRRSALTAEVTELRAVLDGYYPGVLLTHGARDQDGRVYNIVRIDNVGGVYTALGLEEVA